MFDKVKNKLAWERICMDSTVPYTFKQAIRSMFIPYNIDIDKFRINSDCIENCCERDKSGRLATKSVLETVRDVNYKYSCINCSSMPIWYYMAFPDVFIWTLSNSPQVKTLLKDIEAKYSASGMIDASGEVSIPVVKDFVDAFLKVHNKTLECSI